MSEDRFFINEKIISCSFAMILIFLLSPKHVLDAVVVFGHAHFALTYFYQYKAGKIKALYIAPYILTLALFYYIAFIISPKIFIVFVATFFLLHNFLDEFKVRGNSPSIEYVGVILVFVSILSSIIIESFFSLEVFVPLVSGAIIVCSLIFIVQIISDPSDFRLSCPYMLYLWGLIIAFLGLEMTNNRPNIEDAFGFIILGHYMTWYLRLGSRFWEEERTKFFLYLKRILLTNFIFIVGYFIAVIYMDRQGIFFDSFYSPLGFYVWTLMHLITTLRFSDYKNAFNFSKAVS